MPADALQLLLYGELTRGRSLTTETGWRGIVRELVAMYGGASKGGIRKGAAAAGVGEQTFRDWLKGRHQPSAKNLRKLDATLPARRRHRLPAGREKWLRGKPYIRIVTRTVVPSPKGKKGDDERRRKFEPGPYLPRGALGPMVDQFLAGADMATVAGEFVRAIETYYGGVIILPETTESVTLRKWQ